MLYVPVHIFHDNSDSASYAFRSTRVKGGKGVPIPSIMLFYTAITMFPLHAYINGGQNTDGFKCKPGHLKRSMGNDGKVLNAIPKKKSDLSLYPHSHTTIY